jgi:hypothetical protein
MRDEFARFDRDEGWVTDEEDSVLETAKQPQEEPTSEEQQEELDFSEPPTDASEELEVEEVAPIPPLADRTIEFLIAVDSYQKRLAAARQKTFSLKLARRIPLQNKITEIARGLMQDLIRVRGASLYQEALALEETEAQLKDEVTRRIASSVSSFAKALSGPAIKAYKNKPDTFLTPPNTKWNNGKRQKPKPEKFRTPKERELFGLLVERGMSGGWKVEGSKKTGRSITRSTSLSEIGRRVGLLRDFSRPQKLDGSIYIFTAFSEGKVDHTTKTGRFTDPGTYLSLKNKQLNDEILALYPEVGEVVIGPLGPEYSLNGKYVEGVEIKVSVVKGLPGILMPVTYTYDGSGVATAYGVFTNNPVVTAAQRASDYIVRIPDDFDRSKLNPSIKLTESGLYVDGANLPGDVGALFGGEGNLIRPGTNVPMTEADLGKGDKSRFSDTKKANRLLFVEAYADPAAGRIQNQTFKTGGGRQRRAAKSSLSTTLSTKSVKDRFDADVATLQRHYYGKLLRNINSSRPSAKLPQAEGVANTLLTLKEEYQAR